MIHFDLPKEKSSILKVIGVGGGGGNAVNYMHSQQIDGVNFVICNTDAQALTNSPIPNRIQLGPHLTQGLGAGANPEIGRQATEESLEEIRRILEVNTKMAFITAGMGGGTGTGGAPIIAKICKDLGILTVGIVTTPFAYEGKKRQQQAMDGIQNLKQYVDTLLVISNDKLRHQFGNLKMREAFEKADNVLATAAKCITDVINSTGQINVDFADVCTVMRNGGVAILGNAAAAGENRAQRAIEEALNSPLLNDNDIRGAKWILININSAEGKHEFTMDEVEVIQTYLLSQAGENTDVILGMGYDNSLDDQIGITLIATGFEHKDPFVKPVVKQPEPKKEEKIVMVLGQPEPAPVKASVAEPEPETVRLHEMDVMAAALQPAPEDHYLMPRLVEECPPEPAPVVDFSDLREQEEKPVYLELGQDDSYDALPVVGKMSTTAPAEPVHLTPTDTVSQPVLRETDASLIGHAGTHNSQEIPQEIPPAATASGGYLARPSNIYAVNKPAEQTLPRTAEEPVSPQAIASNEQDELLELQMQLVERDDNTAVEMPLAHQAHEPLNTRAEEPAMPDEAEEQKRRAAERLEKLRNLSFNINAADPNNEFETVPAYIRRNMELYNQSSVAENFYSNIEVKADDKNQSSLSTLNTFLEGKKPD